MATAVLEPATRAATVTEVPVETPRQKLRRLEEEVYRRGMSFEELNGIKRIGDCDQQVELRIAALQKWLAAH